MTDVTDEPLWDAAQVARVLRVSIGHVYRQSDAGRLPVRWVLGLRRYVPNEIRALAGLPDPQPNGGQAA